MRRSDFEGGNSGPLTVWKGMNVYATTIIVGVHLAFLVLSGLIGEGRLANFLEFNTPLVINGEVWRVFSYLFAHEIGNWIMTLIGLYFLYRFGMELEMFFGRRDYLTLYAVLWLATPVAALLFSWASPVAFGGGSFVHFGIFIAYAAVYPRVQFFFGITAAVLAIVFVVFQGLLYLAARQWGFLALHLISAGLAYVMAQYLRGYIEITWPAWMLRFGSLFTSAGRRRAQFKVVSREELGGPENENEVDAILDKIAAKGMASLSSRERAILERARSNLLSREE